MTLNTPLQMLDHWCASQSDTVFLRQPRERQLHDLTWGQTREAVYRLAGALRQLGLKRGDKVAILSKNCAQWFIADLALQAGGFISIPIYPTANADTIRYVLQHSEAKAIFIGKLDDPEAQRDAINPELLRFDMSFPTLPVQYHWHQLLEMTDPLDDTRPELDDVMTIIYTSGSTGNPKGAVMTYRAYAWGGTTVAKHLGADNQDRVISYLPLAHITERVYIEGTAFYSGGTVYFVESLDSFVDDVKVAQPSFFLSVPRLWTLFQKNIIDKVGESKLNLLLKLPIIGSLVARKIRTQLGLNSAKVLGCGSAPVSPSLLHWYRGIGMDITEAWGMTENSAYATLNFPFRPDKIGTVGKPGTDCEVKIGDNQELLFKSPGLFREYYKNPEASAESFTEDGFFRTGDQATVDDEQFVTITGRVKDNFKTAKGKFVAPVPIERKLAQNNHIELVCVIGSGLPYPVALVQLSEGASLLPKEQVRPALAQTSELVSQQMESHATLGGVLVVDEPWDVENEVLTPTLKIKRHVLEQRFGERVAHLKGNQVVWEADL
ncbi:AMP-binding protein [Ferrimonas balearica]|uniref:AMP-binding protein n=1 Tax=Ferrimonas balearica TaxID=44012 RepID=UPI001C9940C1|nr:AMP-binding protein [Ferrimonas balearica]MBY5994106.1 AMP-binding protein [Ferrimonas balearica]